MIIKTKDSIIEVDKICIEEHMRFKSNHAIWLLFSFICCIIIMEMILYE